MGDTNPERSLRQAMLLHAVGEALHGTKHIEKLLCAREWQEVHDYTAPQSKDVTMVSALAGVEMEAVVQWMRNCNQEQSHENWPRNLDGKSVEIQRSDDKVVGIPKFGLGHNENFQRHF